MNNNLDSPILFFDCVPHYGGSNKSTVLLIRELQKLAPVMVLDAYGTCQEYLEDLERQHTLYRIVYPEARYPTIGGHSRTQRFLNVARSIPELIETIKRLRKTINEIQPRAIWVNSQKALFMLSRAIGGKIPTALYVRGELRHISGWAKRDWQGLRLIVGNSRKGLEYFDRLTGFPPRKVVYNGVDVADIVSRSEMPVGDLPGIDSPLKLVMPATLIPLKNHAMAIRGLAAYIHAGGKADLWICGDIPKGVNNPDMDKIKYLPEQLGITQYVHFLGWQKNIPAILRQADVMTLTSRTEGMPRAVMEAMALGRPVLVTAVGGVSELVRDGIDGIVIPSEDVSQFTDALHRLADPEVRRSMGQAAQARIEGSFTLSEQAKIFCDGISVI